MANLKAAIKKTIDYNRRYGKKMSFDDLKLRLISLKKWEASSIKKVLSEEPQLAKEITKSGKTMKQRVKKKMDKAKEFTAKYLSNKRWLLMVAVTGSVAAGRPNKNDDIDLLMITRKNYLWWARLWLRIMIKLRHIPHRQLETKEKKDEFCFNLWLDESALKIPVARRKLQSAMDLVMMKTIFSREGTYQRMLAANGWVKKFLATGYEVITKENGGRGWNKRIVDKYLPDWVNKIFFWPQYFFMKKKIKREIVDLHRAFFHP